MVAAKSSSWRLGALADPTQHTDLVDLASMPAQDAIHALRSMLTIRFAEEAVAELVESGEAVCPCHLGIGQEAVAVGVSASLTPSDKIYGNHRSHPHYLALGGDLFGMFAEILGREAGASRGMGGSMHLYAPEVGFQGSVPIVAATIPVAVGAGLAAKMDAKGAIAVTYFGDGASEEGGFHESLNLASIYKLPVLFVCENNLYSSHLDIGLRQPADGVARFAEAHRMAYRVVDGNDIVAVSKAANELIAAAREGAGPGFLEAVTFRWRGHVGAKEDTDVGVRRKPEILKAWKRRDPIARLSGAMTAAGMIKAAEIESLGTDVRQAVADAVARAHDAAFPPASALMDLVYAPRRAK